MEPKKAYFEEDGFLDKSFENKVNYVSIDDWGILLNPDRLTGKVYNHRFINDGQVITTSPVLGIDNEGLIRTRSGNRYKLLKVKDFDYNTAIKFIGSLKKLGDIPTFFDINGTVGRVVHSDVPSRTLVVEFKSGAVRHLAWEESFKPIEPKVGFRVRSQPHKGDGRLSNYEGKIGSIVKEFEDRVRLRFEDHYLVGSYYENLERVYYYEKKTVISPPSRLIAQLEKEGYELDPSCNGWIGSHFFNFLMLQWCGLAPTMKLANVKQEFQFQESWLDTKYEFLMEVK